MKYLEHHTEEIIARPTVEVATWSAKLHRLDFAQGMARSFFYEGWGDSGHTAWIIANEVENPDEVASHKLFEDAVMYELDGKPDLSYVAFALGERCRKEQNEKVQTMRQNIAKEALSRLGILPESTAEKTELTPAIGALATLCFRRASIKEHIDRMLYERGEDITATEEVISKAVRPRTVEVHYSGEKRRALMYSAATHSAVAPELTKFQGIDPTSTPRQIWWHELQNDFAKIDSAARQLASATDSW